MDMDDQETRDAQETIAQEMMIRGKDLTRAMVTTKILESFADTELGLFVVGLSSIQPFFPFYNRGKRSFDAFRQGSIAPLLAFYSYLIRPSSILRFMVARPLSRQPSYTW